MVTPLTLNPEVAASNLVKGRRIINAVRRFPQALQQTMEWHFKLFQDRVSPQTLQIIIIQLFLHSSQNNINVNGKNQENN
jgi:hypothetical protein